MKIFQMLDVAARQVGWVVEAVLWWSPAPRLPPSPCSWGGWSSSTFGLSRWCLDSLDGIWIL